MKGVLLCLALGVSGVIVSARPAVAADAVARRVVHCYSAADDAVEDLYADACQGTIVSDDEAARIQQERVERNLRAMAPSASPVDPALTMRASGSGFFITSDGAVITNDHVVHGCGAVTVAISSGVTVAAHIVGEDANTDLALLRADATPPAVARLRTPVSYANQAITVIGFPNEGLVAIKPIIVAGTLSGPAISAGTRFAFHADVRPGNSGGPIIDEQGLVVGVVFAKIDTVTVYEHTGQVVAGIGYGIATDTVMRFLKARSAATLASLATPAPANTAPEAPATSFVVRVGCWQP